MKKLLTSIVLALLVLFAFSMAVSAEDSATECEHTYDIYKVTETAIPECAGEGVAKQGTIVYTCSKCGATKSEHFTADHDYNSVVSVAATCTTKGKVNHTCKYCKHSYTEDIGFTHNYYNTMSIAPTCTQSGEKTKTCRDCGTVTKVEVPPQHKKTNRVVLQASTCFLGGTERFTCSDCNKTFTVDTAANKHSFENYVITQTPIPKCQADTRPGVALYTCFDCGLTMSVEFNYDHHYHSTVIKASCDKEGSITYNCEKCDYSYSETLPKAHTFHEVVTVAPTCTTDGVMTKTCSTCNAVETDVAIPARHTVTNLELQFTPSCFSIGLVNYDCSACGGNFTQVIAKSHDYESTVSKEATCTEDGILRHTCKHCLTTHTDVILASHDYGHTPEYIVRIVYHDFTKTGVKYYGCKKCGDVGENAEGIIANPLVIFLGYSIPSTDTFVAATKEGNVEIACTYTIDTDALQEYLRINGANSLEYGLVGAYESHLLQNGVQNPPLNNETGVTNDHITQAVTNNKSAVVKKIKFMQSTYASVTGRLADIDKDNHETFFYFCLYIYDAKNHKTVYISDDSCRDIPLPISYSMLNPKADEDSGHTTHKNSVTIGGMEYSTVKGTAPTQERLTIIANSAAAYKTEYDDKDSASVESTVAGIGNIGQWLGTVPNANELLNYYLELGGDATHYTLLDVATLISKVDKAKTSWTSSINNILRAAELMAIEGETVNIDQVWESNVQLDNASWLWSANRDWYLTFIDGFYYTDTDLDNLTVTMKNGTKTYSATITYSVIDYYSFQKYLNENNDDSFLLWGPSRSQLAKLHLCGAALDFLIESTVTYEVEWTAGERVGKDSLFNSSDITSLGISNETNVGINGILK